MARIPRRYKGVLTPEQFRSLGRAEKRAAIDDGWLMPIAGGALESNINGLWVAKQTAKGTPAVGMTKRLRWTGGDLNVARADSNELYSDSTLFGDRVDFVNQLDGNGAPVVMGQSGAVAYLAWLAGGQEVVTPGVSAVHSLSVTGAPTGGSSQVTFNGYGPINVPWNMTAAAFQAALLAATNSQGMTLPAGSVAVTGGPLPGTPLTITFQGSLRNQPVPLAAWTHADAFTGGAAPALAVAQTTAGSGNIHVATPANVGGFWSSWVKSVGASVVFRNQFNDCKITTLRLEGSSASKVLAVTPSLLILSPGIQVAADPAVVDDGTKPFIYTEAAGTFTIDGVVYRGHSAFAVEIQYALTEWFGDDVTAYDVVNGTADVVLQGVTILLDQQGLARYNEQIYGTASPAANAAPLKVVPANGAYSCQFNRVSPYTGGTSESCKVEVPSVKWDPGLTIPANPAGGPVELAMAGEYRKDPGGAPAWRITTTSPYDAAYTT